MKIGLYHNHLPVPGTQPGGVAVFVHRLARELSDHGHHVTVWSRSAAPADATYRHIRLWPRLRTESRLVRTFLVPILLNDVKWRGIDVLHLHGDDFLTVHRPIPTVRTLHGSALLELRHAKKAKQKLSYSVITVLEYFSARLAVGCYGGGPGVPGVYPTNGTIDYGVNIPQNVQLERDGCPSIVFVGTWGGRKRGRLLHKVFTEYVRPQIPDAELWMVSDHCEEAPGVKFVHAPDDETIQSLYARAWVMCHPSTYEGFGIPYVEAMAAGTPIVSSSNPGVRHVLGDELAREVVVEDDDLGQALVTLLRDGSARRGRAERGRDRVRRFSWDAVIARHVEIYESAISDYHGGSRRRRR